jgi:hypothetical protein
VRLSSYELPSIVTMIEMAILAQIMLRICALCQEAEIGAGEEVSTNYLYLPTTSLLGDEVLCLE